MLESQAAVAEIQKTEANTVADHVDELTINPKVVVGFFGAICCYAWFFLALGTSVFYPVLVGPIVFLGIPHLTFMGGVCVGAFIVWSTSDFMSTHDTVQFCLSAAMAVVSMVCLWIFQSDLFLLSCATFSFGIGFAFMYVLYGEFICVHVQGSVRTCIDAIFVGASLIVIGPLFASGSASYVLGSLFPIAALIVYGIARYGFKLEGAPLVTKRESDSRNHVVWRSYLATITSGLAVGFALGCLLFSLRSHDWVYILCAFFLLLTCVLLLFDSCKLRKLTESVTMRFFLPAAAIVVFPMLFVTSEWIIPFALLLLCGAMFPTTCSISAMCKHIRICHLSAIRSFSLGRLMSFIGILFGMLIALLGFLPTLGEEYSSILHPLSVIIFMLLVIFSASFVMTEDNYPNEDRFRVDENADDGIAIIAPVGTPLKNFISAQDDMAEERTNEHLHSGVFQMKCQAVAQRYGLSNRQSEVLTMLAKGRNAGYITEKLVISAHTAKAHIYNIYQKTGVHSRQELMDLVETFEVDTSEKTL